MARTIAKDHDQKRDLILKAAARIFATEGFDRASMAQLARACGISKANIYHYYDSKDALLFDILDIYLRDLRDQILATDVADLDPEQRLHKVIHRILHAYQGADHEHQVQLNALGALPEAEQAQMRAYQRDMVRFLSDTIKSAAPAALATDKAKLRATTMSVFGMLNWYYMWNTGAGGQARDDYATLVTNLTLRGVTGL
jgi:AcrR family transcriptional regulator